MAKRTVYLPKQEPENVTDTDEVEVIDIDPDTLIGEAVAEFGGEPEENVQVKIYQVNPEGKGTLDWCFNAAVSELPVSDRIRARFGAGKYEIRIYTGAKIRRRLPFNIAPEIAPPEPKPADNNVMVGALEKLGQMVFQMNESMQQRLEAMRPAVAAPLDPLQMQQNIVATMLQMKQLFAPEAPQGNSNTLAFEAFVKGVEVMKDVGGEGGEKGLWDVLVAMAQPDGLLGKLTDAAQAMDNKLTHPPQLVGPDGRPLPTAAVSTGTEQPTQTGQPTDAQRAMDEFRIQVGRLVGLAKRGADPGLYAEVVIDTVGAQAAGEFVNDPNAMRKLATIHPDVAQHQEWFRALGVHINDLLTDEAGSESDGATQPEGGDVAPSENTGRDTPRDT